MTPDGRQLRLALLISVLVGIAVSVQSRINSELAVRLVAGGESQMAAGFQTALVSFGVGLALLLVVAAVVPRMRRGLRAIRAAVRDQRLRTWQLLGGIAGAWLVATQGLTIPTLGVALFTVSVVAGQVFGSLGVDAAGLGPAGALRPTVWRLTGALIALAAVVVTVAPRLEASAGANAAFLGLLALSAGLGISVQQALNAHVAIASGWAMAAAAVNFVVGAAVLASAVLLGSVLAGWSLAGLPPDPWLYLGGLLGVLFIAMAAWVVPIIGVLRFALASICGQLVGGALLDTAFPQTGVVVGWQLWTGVLLTLLAVAVANRR